MRANVYEVIGRIIDPRPAPRKGAVAAVGLESSQPAKELIGKILSPPAGALKRSLAALAVTVGISACGGAEAAPVGPSLAEIRAATERFQDVNVALAEGYIPDPHGMCVTAEMEGRKAEEGGMGIHYLRPDLLQITAVEPRVDGMSTHTDFAKPAILIYEPQADGSLELVAVENLVFRKAWYAAGNTQPPSFRGVQYDRMIDDPDTPFDEAHGFEPHYDLHVWLFRDNPLGVFSPFNPNVTCRHHRQETGHRH
jgi:hypothetical protein